MTDFTSEEKELAKWIMNTFEEYVTQDLTEKYAWCLLARELLKNFNIKLPYKVDEHWNCGYCGNSWHDKENAEYCCNYKSCFNTLIGHEASVPTEDESRNNKCNHDVMKRNPASVGLSLCRHCGCMTKNKCGKCGGMK